MTRRLRTHWVIWSSLVLIVATGAIISSLSSSPTITSIELAPNASVNVSVFRPLPEAIRLSMEFERPKGQKRPELGEYTYRGDWRRTGFLDFANPGAPIKLLVLGEGKEVIYEAMPAGSYGTTIGRELVPFVDDENPNRFQWPPNLTLRHSLPVGYSDFIITVQEVGSQLKGEKVKIIIEPPVTFKTVAPRYGYIWWFIFWPLYALPLLAYGLVLLWRSLRHSPNITVERDASPQSGSRPSPSR